MTTKEISNIIEQIIKAEEMNGKYGNGTECKYQRIIIGKNEYTMVDRKLYVRERYFDGEKETYSTVTRIKEGRREDKLAINGISARFAYLAAININSENEFFKTC